MLDIKPCTFRARLRDLQAQMRRAVCNVRVRVRFYVQGLRTCRAERVDWLSSRSIAPPRLRPWVNACDRHPIAMPPRKPLYILVGMFYNPSKDTLVPVRAAEADGECRSSPCATLMPAYR